MSVTHLKACPARPVNNRYVYSPIPVGSIRLLSLLPDDDPNSPLTCQLIDHVLRKPHDDGRPDLFEALSYVWGSSETPCAISLVIPSRPGVLSTLPITSSLHTALLRLRGRTVPRFMWIDAVCINQEDMGERASQILLMTEIYCRANRVVVWLGEAEDGGDVALDQIRSAAIPEAIREDWGMVFDRRDAEAGGSELAGSHNGNWNWNSEDNDTNRGGSNGEDKEEQTVSDNASHRAVLSLLQRPWFRRIWVLQEVAAARHILVKCGATEVDGYAFCHGLRSMESYLHALRNPELLERINPIVYLVRGSIFRSKSYTTSSSGEVSLGIRPFRELLDMYRTHRATDPRDRIFALLGMCSDGPTVTAAGLAPDYTVGWPDLVSRLAKFFLGNQITTEPEPGQGAAAERVLIKGRGYFLGKVDHEYTKQRNGWQEISMILHECIEAPPHDLPAPAVRARRGDIVCQLMGASEPMLVRPCPDGCFTIIAIAVPALPDSSGKEEASNDPRQQHSLTLALDFREVPGTKNATSQGNEDEEESTVIPTTLEQMTRLCHAALALEYLGRYQAASANFRAVARGLEVMDAGAELTSVWDDGLTLLREFAEGRLGGPLGHIWTTAATVMEEERDGASLSGTKMSEVFLATVIDMRAEIADRLIDYVGDGVNEFKKTLMREVVKMRAQVQGLYHPDTLRAREALAATAMVLETSTTGPESWHRLVEDRIRVQGAHHPEVASCFDRLVSHINEKRMPPGEEQRTWFRAVRVLIGREEITEGGIADVAAHQTGTLMRLLLDKLDDQRSNVGLGGAIVEAAAGNKSFGKEMMQTLFDVLGDGVSITERVLERAAQNSQSGEGVLKMLLERRGNSADTAGLPITEDALQAVLQYGLPVQTVLMPLLEQVRGEALISERLLVEAVNVQDSEKEALRLLLERLPAGFQAAESLLIAAARSGEKALEVLLAKLGMKNVVITEDVVIAAAESWRDRGPESSSMVVMLSRAWQEGVKIQLTEPVVQAAVEAGNWDLLGVILGWRARGATITNELTAKIEGIIDAELSHRFRWDLSDR